jgi:pimeloyl-ACP methyl ester carboxylesterase
MAYLDVSGARLYYEVRGAGPLLVLVPGAKGEAGIYQRLAEELAPRYRVITYDRRGFSRSTLTGTQDYEHRLATDTGDLNALIAHLADGPAAVFGNSSGAIIALDLLTHHPGPLAAVIAHEPPLVNLLPDAATWREFFDSVYDTYRAAGIPAAMHQFSTAFADNDRQAMHRQTLHPATRSEHLEANSAYWMEHELRQYPRTDLDLQSLARNTAKLILAAGSQSCGQVTHRTTQALADQLGSGLCDLPGGHTGCVTHSTEFAAALGQVLDQRRQF